MKKLVAFLLVVTLGVVFTIGCKPKEPKKQTTPPVEKKAGTDTTKAPTATPKAGEPGKEGTGPAIPEPAKEPGKTGATKAEPPAPPAKTPPPKK
ncbi:MAG: hypothetical protein LLG00_03945 [Planctomycetaceae bacterium]|nr:hypothetical protein [Planctomycetaceae bacterium]